MLNIIWPIFIITGCIYAIINGKVSDINNAVFESTNNAIEIIITMFGTVCLWNGIMQIASNTSIVKIIMKIIKPIMKIIFPELKENMIAYKEITMNIIANIMGLGNAATPLGLKAMKSLQRENNNKKRLTNSMAMFIIINTASLQIIPTTVIAIRNSLGSEEPTAIIIPVWLATFCAAIVAIISGKIFIKRF